MLPLFRRRSARDTAPILQARGVGFAIDDQVLLAPTDVSVTAGERVAVRGQNGTGKTTLLRLLAGHLRPTSGTTSFRSGPVDERRVAVRAGISAGIGMPEVYPDLTVREQLWLIATSWRMPAADAADAVERTLAQLTLTDLARRFAHELSSGQTQLYHLGCALVRPFDVLLLDEPEQRLDARRRAMLADVLRGVCRRGAAVVFATHDARLAAAADRELRLDASS